MDFSGLPVRSGRVGLTRRTSTDLRPTPTGDQRVCQGKAHTGDTWAEIARNDQDAMVEMRHEAPGGAKLFCRRTLMEHALCP